MDWLLVRTKVAKQFHLCKLFLKIFSKKLFYPFFTTCRNPLPACITTDEMLVKNFKKKLMTPFILKSPNIKKQKVLRNQDDKRIVTSGFVVPFQGK
jgi:hypothetical protein